MSGASGSKGHVVDLADDSATFVLRMSTSHSASVCIVIEVCAWEEGVVTVVCAGRRVCSDSSVCVGGGGVVIVVCAWEEGV